MFERRDAKSPIYWKPCVYETPYLIYDFNVRWNVFLVIQKYFSFTTEYIAHAVRDNFSQTIFNFCFLLNLSFQDICKLFEGDILYRWKLHSKMKRQNYVSFYKNVWSSQGHKPSIKIDYQFKLSSPWIEASNVFKDLVFTRNNTGHNVIYTHSTHCYHSMPETVEHRNIRCRLNNLEDSEAIIDVVNDDPTAMVNTLCNIMFSTLKLHITGILKVLRDVLVIIYFASNHKPANHEKHSFN